MLNIIFKLNSVFITFIVLNSVFIALDGNLITLDDDCSVFILNTAFKSFIKCCPPPQTFY